MPSTSSSEGSTAKEQEDDDKSSEEEKVKARPNKHRQPRKVTLEDLSSDEEESAARLAPRPFNTGKLFVGLATFVVCVAVGISVGRARMGPAANPKSHATLISLSERFPILKTIGEYFHTKKVTQKEITNFDARHYYDWNWKDGPIREKLLLNDDDIALVKGGHGRPLLVILGHVFDVATNYPSYKEGTGYHGFIGQDGSRAFVTGDFTSKGFTSNLDALKPDDYIGLVKWISFYYKTYPHVGYHIGRFFDKDGEETEYYQRVRQWVKHAEDLQEADGNVKKQFPPCNMEWSAKTETTEYWCSKKSGGIDRDWEGYPYQFQETEGKPYRCACLHTNHLKDPRVKPYDNCPPKSVRCKMASPKTS